MAELDNLKLVDVIEALKMAEGSLSSFADRGAAQVQPIVEHIRGLLERVDELEAIPLSLNVFDENGDMIEGEVNNVSLTTEQIADIIDHATQVAIVAGKTMDKETLGPVIDELSEALETYELVEPNDGPSFKA